jgi:hypothetical protein
MMDLSCRDQQASAEVEHKYSEVQYQRLGYEGKKGIPDDGHRGWKKYGNKSIQNANFCRYAMADELENFPQVLKISSALVYYTSSWIS